VASGSATGAEGDARTAGVGVFPLVGLPLVGPSDDLGALLISALGSAGPSPRAGDVIVVAQKVVSKAEGRQVRLDRVSPSPEAEALAARSGKPAALCQLMLNEAAEVMRARADVVIIRHRLGHVAANAGIDSSNVEAIDSEETALLWPVSPDASAAALRRGLEAHFRVRLAVIISDSLGRAWRVGTMGTAIGVAGMAPLRDRRGEADLYGRTLRATVTGVADEIAAAASLVIGEGAEGVPAALVRGAVYTPADDDPGMAALLRPLEQDLFR
jgi:coenzyme F420-0:L-glutamate ligase/coenzyme F420-1:gamma-L-glutamate ligase